MAQNDVTRKSVTHAETERRAEYSRYFISPLATSPMVALPYELSAHWTTRRDVELLAAYKQCGLWADAVRIFTTRMASQGWELAGDIGLRVRQAREMLGQSWFALLQKVGRDWAVADNGAFVEVVRATSGYGSKVMGLVPLRSSRCVRTGNPDIPVLYVDELGQWHEMRSWQVAEFVDMPDDDLLGVGLCPTSTAYDALYEYMAVRSFFKEKATGRRPLAIDFISGLSQKQVNDMLGMAQAEADQRGILSYMGASVAANPNDTQVSGYRVNFAELPDGFDQQQHTQLTQILFATALGIDPVDLNPQLIGNRSLGAGSQAKVLDDKQASKGYVALRQQWIAFLNDTARWHVLPNAVTFAFVERDLADQKTKADITKARVETRAAQIASGEIDAAQAKQLAVDVGDLPDSFLTVDQTPEETISDEDKADAESAPELAPVAKPAPVAVMKEVHSGAMVALHPAMDEAKRIANQMSHVDWPEGATLTEANELHVTLAFLGKADEIPAERRAEMMTAARMLAQTDLPNVRFNGVARFYGNDEDGDAIVVLLSEPTLNEMGELARQKIGNASEHPFTAHMTLAYVPKDAPTPTVPKLFDAIQLPVLSIVFAGERTDLALGGVDAVTKAFARFKAASTTLATVTMSSRKRNVAYWQQVTKALSELGRIWTIAARQHAPQDEGETARSIRFAVTNKDTRNVTLKLFAGNEARPEVAVRAVLFGRKGFGPKRAKVLRFRMGNQTVFARKVKGALANDWASRAWRQVGPQLKAIEAELGAMPDVATIDVSDVAGAVKRTRQSQIKVPKT